MDKPIYKLSSVLGGHLSDVRAVATFADGTIVSTSRDKTARLWKPSGNNRDYVSTTTLLGHSNFVGAVCVINPSAKNPEGLIITGGNDRLMCVYVLSQAEPVKTIEAHQNTICKLTTSQEDGKFLSSSWDTSAKLWDTSDLATPRLSLTGHTAAVWSVADLANGMIITGSTDKSIIVWTRSGTIHHRLEGHSDCVRDIAPIKEDEFLSCANDATVRHWNASSGTCLGTYCGHNNYIYSIVALEQGTTVFTSGEDRTIRVWRSGELNQTITLPTQSAWCLDLLPNGDLVSGSSDGYIRIFSTNPERYADPEILEKFDKEVAETELNAQLELGGIKIKDLPDKSALQQPGQKDGQTKIIQDGDAVHAYSWSQSERKWIRIGDVMGASGGTQATSGKQLYNGIEYDYVFSVDIQDGVPPLKLPYNRGQDPWHVAQKFLHDNDLSQLFLDQVANFIIKNSEPAPILNTQSYYADPFTGGSRYIPASGTTNSVPHVASTMTESFSTPDVSGPSAFTPHTSYLKLEQANLSAILDKLREFNGKQNDNYQVPEAKLESVIKMVAEQSREQLDPDAIETLRTLFNWSNDTVFPVLDVARLAVLQKRVNDELCTDELLRTVRDHLRPNANANNQMLVFRLLANMFCYEKGETLGLTYKDDILVALLQLESLGAKGNQIAIATYILNMVVALNKYNDTSGKTQFLNAIVSILSRLKEAEAKFRTLVALGSLLSTASNPEERDQLTSAVKNSEIALNTLKTMSEITPSTPASNKVAKCSTQIINMIV